MEFVHKGMVMEVSRRHCVVLTPEGRFVKVPKQDDEVEIGQEITFELEKKPFLLLTIFSRKPVMVGGLASVMVLLMILLPLLMTPSPAHAETYIYIDLNPSLELGLDKKNRVVDVRAFNSTGEELIRNLDWKGVPAKQLVVQILNQARQQGFLEPNERILVSQVAMETKEREESGNTLSEIAKSVGTDRELSESKVDLYTLPLPDALKVEAEKTGLSPSKYAVWLMAKRSGLQLTIEELTNLSMTELMEMVDLTPVLRNPPSKEEWEKWIEEEKKGEENQVPSDKDEIDEEEASNPPDEPSDSDDEDVEEEQDPEKDETPKNDSSNKPEKEEPKKEDPHSSQPDPEEEESDPEKPEPDDPSIEPLPDPEKDHGHSTHSNDEALSLE